MEGEKKEEEGQKEEVRGGNHGKEEAKIFLL
jgi:hypothetical protein